MEIPLSNKYRVGVVTSAHPYDKRCLGQIGIVDESGRLINDKLHRYTESMIRRYPALNLKELESYLPDESFEDVKTKFGRTKRTLKYKKILWDPKSTEEAERAIHEATIVCTALNKHAGYKENEAKIIASLQKKVTETVNKKVTGQE